MQISHNASISVVNAACFKGMAIITLTRETQSAKTHALCLWSVGAGNLQLDPVPISSEGQCSEPVRKITTSPCSGPSDPCGGVSIKLSKRSLLDNLTVLQIEYTLKRTINAKTSLTLDHGTVCLLLTAQLATRRWIRRLFTLVLTMACSSEWMGTMDRVFVLRRIVMEPEDAMIGCTTYLHQ